MMREYAWLQQYKWTVYAGVKGLADRNAMENACRKMTLKSCWECLKLGMMWMEGYYEKGN